MRAIKTGAGSLASIIPRNRIVTHKPILFFQLEEMHEPLATLRSRPTSGPRPYFQA